MQDQMASATVNVSTILAVYGNGDCNMSNNKFFFEQNPIPRNLREDENAHAKMISKRIRRRLDGCEHLQTITDSSSLTAADTTKSSSNSRRQGIDSLPMCHEGPEMTTTEQVIIFENKKLWFFK